VAGRYFEAVTVAEVNPVEARVIVFEKLPLAGRCR
jgi:hypothetical protein